MRFLHRPCVLAPDAQMSGVIDLKIGALSPADIAQMQLYLRWVRNFVDPGGGENRPSAS